LPPFAGVSVAQNSRGGVDDVLVYERQGWIWTCDGEGKGQTRLVQGARPGVSADGRLIAYFRPSRGKTVEEMSDLWIYDREGGETMIAPSFLPHPLRFGPRTGHGSPFWRVMLRRGPAS
jgi:hypothetical protein